MDLFCVLCEVRQLVEQHETNPSATALNVYDYYSNITVM
jgi:hypothetical protein